MDPHPQLAGNGPWQRFIVRFRAGTGPEQAPTAALERISRRAPAGTGIAALTWLRRLGVGADLFETDRPLDRAAATRLLEALAADPDVEYAEVDAMMQIAGSGGRHGPQ